MKTSPLSLRTKYVPPSTIASVALAFAPTASAATLVVSDVIAVDLSSAGDSAADFNVFNTNFAHSA